MTAAMNLRVVEQLLGRHAFMFSSEVDLHERIAELLTRNGLPFEREVELDAANRADFVIDGAMVVEVKIEGSMEAAVAQALRYAKLPTVKAVLLASSCSWARNLPAVLPEFRNRVAVVHVRRAAL